MLPSFVFKNVDFWLELSGAFLVLSSSTCAKLLVNLLFYTFEAEPQSPKDVGYRCLENFTIPRALSKMAKFFSTSVASILTTLWFRLKGVKKSIHLRCCTGRRGYCFFSHDPGISTTKPIYPSINILTPCSLHCIQKKTDYMYKQHQQRVLFTAGKRCEVNGWCWESETS